MVDFDRDFYGADVNYAYGAARSAAARLTTTARHRLRPLDATTARATKTSSAPRSACKGALRRDEQDGLSSLDPYLQSEWQRGPWVLTGGLRHTRLRIDVADAYLANGNDSGGVAYSHTTPVLGVLYKVDPLLNVYASAARGFETPTLNEVFYSGTGGGFNFGLKAAQSTHLEVGAKAIVGDHRARQCRAVPGAHARRTGGRRRRGGRTSYSNASKTLRQGGELSLDARLGQGLVQPACALTMLRAVYDQAFGTRPAGQPPARRAEREWLCRTGVEGWRRPLRRRHGRRRQQPRLRGRRQR